MHFIDLKQAVRVTEDMTIGTGFEFVCNVFGLFVDDANDVHVLCGDNEQSVSGELDNNLYVIIQHQRSAASLLSTHSTED